MSSAQSASVIDALPAPPVFSYAQAAKGQATVTPVVSAQSYQSEEPASTTPTKDHTPAMNTQSEGSEKGTGSLSGTNETTNRSEAMAEDTALAVKGRGIMVPDSLPSSPGVESNSPLATPKDENKEKGEKDDKEDEFTLVEHQAVSKDRSVNEGTSAAKLPDATEGRKGKKGKKQKSAEKDPEHEKEEVKPEVFVPAPLPSVNFWSQRKEELAKTKSSPIDVRATASPQEPSGAADLGLTQSAKITDSRKRGKSIQLEDGDKGFSPAPNGGARDGLSAGKGQKRGTEIQPKLKEDSFARRAGLKGARSSEKEEKSSSSQLPPPVEDAMSWPTPDTALEGEKRKVQEKLEREEKDESVQNKPRPKEKWVTVPYIPTVTFNTPLPSRGGRGRGGARGGRPEPGARSSHAQNAGSGADKAQVSSGPAGGFHTGPEKQESRDTARASSLPPNKRQPVEQSSNRKSSTTQGGEKGKAGLFHVDSHGANDLHPSTESRHTHQESTQDQQYDRPDSLRSSRAGQHHSNVSDHARSSRSHLDHRSDSNFDGSDHKESAAFKRGRGGFRGRGNHSNFQNGQNAQTAFANGHSPTPNGYPMRHNTAPYSPPLQQNPFNGQYPPPRNHRGGSRSQSIPNNAVYGRYPPNGASISHMAPIQTTNTMLEYSPMQPMSAMPFQPYMDHASVLAMVTMQLEYYFSIDNLCKDVFLRKHMDSQGFVFLSFIAAFKRIQALTQDFELLRFACQESEVIELVRGEDGIDRLRRGEGWEKWVLGMEERDESTRNDGPTFYQRPQHYRNGPQLTPTMMTSHHPMSPQTFSPTSHEQGFQPQSNGIRSATNGNGGHYQLETPLSAAVPDFSPGSLPPSATPNSLDAATTFHDDEVANLTLVFNQPRSNDDSNGSRNPFHNASSRTFSNGSIDSRSMATEIQEDARQGRSLINGSHASESTHEGLHRSRSPFSPVSPSKTYNTSTFPVMWVKGQQPAIGSDLISHELYIDFRGRALKHREISSSGEVHPDMKLLYEFWSHFLCRNFNATMYAEFRQYALEDARTNSFSGMNNLISYYDEILNSKKKVIPEILARHYVELVKDETSNERPAFERLRAAWRNGALDMKSRKRIDHFVDLKLREELEGGSYNKA